MYIPRHHHWAGPAACVLAGFAAYTYLPSWDVVILVQIPLDYVACAWGTYLWKAGLMYQEGETQTSAQRDERQAQRDAEAIARGAGLTPLALKPVINTYQQVVEAPKISAEMYVAHTLLNQKCSKLKVDLGEPYWIKGKRFDGSRETFAEMKRKWAYHHVIQKGRFAALGYTVERWDVIRMISQGFELPSPSVQQYRERNL